jgi:hypothetical protein
VKFDGEMKDFSLKLFDITGKEIYSEVGLNATAFSVKKINTEGMAIGLYILKIQNSNTVKTVKFVVD